MRGAGAPRLLLYGVRPLRVGAVRVTEPLQLELEATPLPPAIRALCFGGPWNGSVMMAPVVRTQLFGHLPLAVRIDGRSAHFRTHADAAPWIGGTYVLTNAGPETRQAARQVAAVIGEPKDTGVCWTWYQHADDYDICLLSERMVKVHVLCPEPPDDPYEPSAAMREIAEDLELEAVVHPDGDVSFRRAVRDHADDVMKQIYEELDRAILGHPYRRDPRG